MDSKVLTVSEFNNLIKKNLESIDYFKSINVTGELSNLTFNKTGHIYFSIKDQGASISCMIWKDKAHILKAVNPKEGMKLTVSGRLTYYVPSGKTNFEVVDVKLDGLGYLHILYNERKNELEKSGWFDESIKKTIPRFPKNIGIVTASTGAAVQDLIKTITRRFPQVNIFIFPTLVQGEQAQFDIADKINQANNFKTPIDTLIVGRGGGSYEDLWSFNEMVVLEAIRKSDIPIISAIGHEPDITLADYVSDLRAATPTAAGEIATPSIEELRRHLEMLKNDLTKSVIKVHNDFKKELRDLYLFFFKNSKKLVQKSESDYQNLVNNLRQIINAKIFGIQNYLENVEEKQIQKINSIVEMRNFNLKHFSEKINLLSPLKPLENGFALIRDQDNKIIKNIKNMKNQEKINVEMIDGRVTIKTKNNIEENLNGK
ncbi:exodeoxyribonuclease VII large subunit [Spiroplasma sabaudiense Ar-1343]|uniref:Exodeoxyribonuclease 7 large subunit n=1 Tax=Spiroplasma sabaudiense Ar-1343 TaxID=1276257 RepID=W6A9Q0_9MOLU|nr:exodeoxyribonuclease VII large subunit [Spiroplasma sabaudiense]AHI53898.1 exodeoxyribonuclease VII large subunit [Spiroplasma sabaudiense Ar-1343]